MITLPEPIIVACQFGALAMVFGPMWLWQRYVPPAAEWPDRWRMHMHWRRVRRNGRRHGRCRVLEPGRNPPHRHLDCRCVIVRMPDAES